MARGSIQDRGDRWEVVISLGRDPVTGRRRRQSKTLPKATHNRDQAERALTRLLAKADANTITPTSGTVGQVVEAWLELVERDRSPTTLTRYRQLIDDYIQPRWGNVKLPDLRLVDIDQWYQSLLRDRVDKKGRERKALAASSVRQVHSVLRSALKQAVRWGYLPGNPAQDARLPSLPDDEMSPPTMAEVRAVIAEIGKAKAVDLAAFVVLTAATGVRRSEMCGLRWRDIDLKAGEVRVRRSLVQTSRTLHEKAPKNRSSLRSISIDPPVVEYMKAYRLVVVDRAAQGGVELDPAAWVFSRSLDGTESVIPDSMTHAWRRYARKAKVDARLHDLRHAHATELIAAGIDIRTVAARLGHAQTSTTLNIYSHAMKARDQEAAAIIGGKLLGPEEGDEDEGEEHEEDGGEAA